MNYTRRLLDFFHSPLEPGGGGASAPAAVSVRANARSNCETNTHLTHRTVAAHSLRSHSVRRVYLSKYNAVDP